MPHTCKDHRQSVLVRGGNDFVIAHRAAGLNDGGDAVTGLRIKWPVPLSKVFTERALVERLIQRFVEVRQP